MPEVTPSIGADGNVSFEVTRGNGASDRGFDSAASEVQGLASQEEVALHRESVTAKNLANRAAEEYVTGGTTDEDLDNGTYNAEVAAKEERLAAIQAQLYKASSPAEIAQLEQQAFALANEIVTGRAADLPSVAEDEFESQQEFDDEVKQVLGEDWERAISAAQERFSEEEITTINDELLSDSDPLVRKAAAYGLKELVNNKEAINTSRENAQGIAETYLGDLTERYGSDTADKINTISQAVLHGHTTSAAAFKLVARDPKLLGSMLQEVRSGRMKLNWF